MRADVCFCTVTLFGLLGMASAAPAAAQTTCAQFATIPVSNGEYNIQTNEWNSSSQQCLTISGSSFTISTANFNLPTDGPPATYPSIYKGCHWGNCTAQSNLPVQVSNIGAASSSWRTTPAPGNWNTAYDIWFNQTPSTGGQPNGAELMIWINHQGPPQPAGSKVGTVMLDGAEWDVWVGNAGWNLISYVRTQPAPSVEMDLKAFISDAVGRGQVQPSWWLIAIEAGFEIWSGGQGLVSNSFAASVATGGGEPAGNAPIITSLAPTSGVPGASMVISGSHFGSSQGASAVQFGSATAAVTSWTDTTITAMVPDRAAGSVGVTVTVGGVASNPAAFTIKEASSGGAGCRVNYSIVNNWPGGFQASLAITNTGSAPINGWSLRWYFSEAQKVTNLWNGAWAQADRSVTVNSLSYNATIAPGNSYSGIGLTGSFTGSNTSPDGFSLNGVPCR